MINFIFSYTILEFVLICWVALFVFWLWFYSKIEVKINYFETFLLLLFAPILLVIYILYLLWRLPKGLFKVTIGKIIEWRRAKKELKEANEKLAILQHILDREREANKKTTEPEHDQNYPNLEGKEESENE